MSLVRTIVFVVTLASLVSFSATVPAGPPKPASVDTAIVRVGGGSSATDAFVVWPAKRKEAPIVIVVHEWWGLNGQIRDVARRLARDGYVAIVPDLFHGNVATDAEQAHVLSRGLEDATALADLGAAATWVRSHPDLAKSKLGVVGFCMGGRLAQMLALQGAGLSAAVMFYGPPETDPKALAALRVPLQGHFGAADDGIPAQRVEELRQGVRRAGRAGEVYVYPGAGHAFMNEERSSYHADAARQAWARTLAFLQKHLKG